MKPFNADDLASALNEWMCRYIEEPERFQAEMRTVALFVAEETAGREPTYGSESTAYLDKIRGDLATGVDNLVAAVMAPGTLAPRIRSRITPAPRQQPKKAKAAKARKRA